MNTRNDYALLDAVEKKGDSTAHAVLMDRFGTGDTKQIRAAIRAFSYLGPVLREKAWGEWKANMRGELRGKTW